MRTLPTFALHTGFWFWINQTVLTRNNGQSTICSAMVIEKAGWACPEFMCRRCGALLCYFLIHKAVTGNIVPIFRCYLPAFNTACVPQIQPSAPEQQGIHYYSAI
ncbi:hypothetical protein BHC49_10160 [Snodgrassella alvi]|uniref:Uncharacterized protein n=1 Tax=Snodgrassella alvi TaxID=1196083 RepID=A0A2N9XVD5_9NEIS|nr:hypothetical protein BHC49_10160 [Snodgrassella alvi]